MRIKNGECRAFNERVRYQRFARKLQIGNESKCFYEKDKEECLGGQSNGVK